MVLKHFLVRGPLNVKNNFHGPKGVITAIGVPLVHVTEVVVVQYFTFVTSKGYLDPFHVLLGGGGSMDPRLISIVPKQVC